MVFPPDSASFFEDADDDQQINQLLQYMQHQSPDVLARVAKAVTPEVKQIVSQNVQGLVGVLPNEAFNTQVTTDKENLASLLASAMMTGYFLRRMEQRMELEDGVVGAMPQGGDRPDAEDSQSQ
ncbi:MAG: DUF760 domain-containing protein [Cyanobacteria bacterium P01_A01_bin.135]